MNFEQYIAPGVFAAIIGAIAWAFNRSIVGKMDEMASDIRTMKNQMANDREKLLTEFTPIATHNKLERDNHVSHSTIWGQFNSFKDDTFSNWKSEIERRMTVVETTQVNCKTCN